LTTGIKAEGYGREVVEQTVGLVRGQGVTELLTSYAPGEGGPPGFYARLGFIPTGEFDPQRETILRPIVHGLTPEG
jgi:diamine N-acetyltransferase